MDIYSIMEEPSPRSQCVSLRLDQATLTEIEGEVTKDEGVTLSAAMNQKLNDGFELIVKAAKNGVKRDD